MIYGNKEMERSAIFGAAKLMVAAARTAPKARGIDNIETLILDGGDKDALAAEMRKLADETGVPIFTRDAGNVDHSEYVVLIGVKNIPNALKNCGLCGFENCAETVRAGANCTFNITDLGIALGSAAAIAADNRIDNRIMWTVGKAARRLLLMPERVEVCYGIPLSTAGKSIYYDRTPV
ncbi:MAG: DUF2148 domain-containing protein [Clostridiales Family XIII bacterium]|jgi:uncharacterized ferredoxin-like protein|nr:DUF2148 domain-containing protein [Clostridiales Family XIII bacterium]